MSTSLQAESLAIREEHLVRTLSSHRFRAMEGLGNEVPFFICPFAVAETVEIANARRRVINKLASAGVTVLSIDLYDLSLELLRARGVLDRLCAAEQGLDKRDLLDTLRNLLDPETTLAPAIAERLAAEATDMVFITGVGEVYPYIRSHNILNNLQSVAKDRPLVMFFPGDYRQSASLGSSLELFGRLHDDQYYRAFNIFEYAV